jgi:hypothetical protein
MPPATSGNAVNCMRHFSVFKHLPHACSIACFAVACPPPTLPKVEIECGTSAYGGTTLSVKAQWLTLVARAHTRRCRAVTKYFLTNNKSMRFDATLFDEGGLTSPAALAVCLGRQRLSLTLPDLEEEAVATGICRLFAAAKAACTTPEGRFSREHGKAATPRKFFLLPSVRDFADALSQATGVGDGDTNAVALARWTSDVHGLW